MNYTDKLIEAYLTEGHTAQSYKGYTLDVNDDEIEDALENGWSSLDFVSIIDPQDKEVAKAKSYSEARDWVDKNGNFIDENQEVEIKLTWNDVPYKNYCKYYADRIKASKDTVASVIDDYYDWNEDELNTKVYNDWIANNHKPTAEELMKYFPEAMAFHYRMNLIMNDEDNNWGILDIDDEGHELHVDYCTNANGYEGDPDNLPNEAILHLEGPVKDIITALYNSWYTEFAKPANKIYLDNFAEYIEDMVKNNKLTGTYSYDTPMGKMVVKIEIKKL